MVIKRYLLRSFASGCCRHSHWDFHSLGSSFLPRPLPHTKVLVTPWLLYLAFLNTDLMMSPCCFKAALSYRSKSKLLSLVPKSFPDWYNTLHFSFSPAATPALQVVAKINWLVSPKPSSSHLQTLAHIGPSASNVRPLSSLGNVFQCQLSKAFLSSQVSGWMTVPCLCALRLYHIALWPLGQVPISPPCPGAPWGQTSCIIHCCISSSVSHASPISSITA